MKVDVLIGRYPRMIGLARYTKSILKYLSKIGADYNVVEPSYPYPIRAGHKLCKPLGYDLKTFFNIFPIAAPLDPNAVTHLTTQMMASLLTFKRRMGPVVVTVHDIVPYLMRDDPEQDVYLRKFDRYVDNMAMQNLRRADRIIAISSYTKRMLVEYLGCLPDKIDVILYGLDHDLFRPVPVGDEFRRRHKLDPQYQYLLYVGSENPRKNLPRLLEAFAKVRINNPNVKLLKIGTPTYMEQHRRLMTQIEKLNLTDAVVFYDHPSQEDLVAFYSMADLFVFPSLYEGFGMPPLEAMACGTAVLASNAASLPEVVGDAAVTQDPYDVQAWAGSIEEILEDEVLRKSLQNKGLARAANFTWENNARATLNVYEQLHAMSKCIELV